MADVAIKVSSVTKSFKLPHERYDSLKGNAIHLFTQKSYSRFDAVNEVSFDIKKGEFFGIVGRNGSGKSTMLKMLAKIYMPTSGAITINGSLSPFIELGVGFNPELSARDNVFLNGAILGLSRKSIEEKFDDIIGFAELENFVDQKLKNFSSGMQVRLAFSIAIQAQSDILLIDEVLAVGDANFQQKCFDVFVDLKKQGKTLVLVTHDMNAIKQFCDRAIMLEDGRVVAEGSPTDISEKYLLANYEAGEAGGRKKKSNQDRVFDNVILKNHTDKPATYFKPQEELRLSFAYKSRWKQPVHFGLQLFSSNDTLCFGSNSEINGIGPFLGSGAMTIALKPNLQSGNYFLSLAVVDESTTRILEFYPRITSFRVSQDGRNDGITVVGQHWKVDA